MTPVSVSSVHAAVRRHLDRRGWQAAAAWAGAGLALLLLLAWWLAGADGWSEGSPWPVVLDLVAVLAVGGGVWTLLRWRRRTLAEAPVARAMERAAGLPDGMVRGSLELGRARPQGVSSSLVARGERTLAARLGGPAVELAGESERAVRGSLRRATVLLAAAGSLVAVVALATPARSVAAWSGLGRPLRVLAGPVLPPLEVHPGTADVPRGEAVELVVTAPRRDSVTVHWQAAGDVARERTLAIGEGTASLTLPAVASRVDYRVEAPDGAVTPTHTLTPVDPLFVTDVTLRLVFPPHTGRSEEEYRGEPPPLEVPVGTRFELSGRGSRPLAGGGLRRIAAEGGPSAEVAFDVERAGFSTTWVPRRSGEYAWWFDGSDGEAAELVPPPLRVTLVPDLPPEVAITLPGQDTVLPLSLRQPLVVQVTDDYGLASLELVARRVTALGEARPAVRQALDLGGVAGALARPLLDVSGWGLLPGDEIRYYAAARDNAPSPQEARTREFVLRMPRADELRRAAQDELEATSDELENLAERARAAAEETRAMEREARAPRRETEGAFRDRGADEGGVDFEERENLARALEEQRAMAASVDSLRRELSELSRTLQDAGAQDPALRDDMDELQSLLEEVAGPELSRRLDELARSMDEMDRRKAREALEDLAREEERFRERLEEALERARRAAVQQDFRATAREAEELAREERALADALEEGGDPGERAEQQEVLRERAEAMDERMERLEERLDELGEDASARSVEQARAQAREAAEAMERAGRQARSGRSQEAAEQAREAAQELDEAARDLQRAQQEMMEERVRALQRALDQTAQDALSLARRQGELREDMRGASAGELADMRGEVAALEQGVRNMAESLAMAQRMAGGAGERQTGTALGQAMGALEREIEALDRPSGSSSSPAAASEAAVDALNRVALTAMAASRQLSQGGGEGTSAEEMLESLEQLAQQQADLNNQASQMMPMQLSQQAMQQQMQEMSQGQQSVASQLGELSNQEGEDGPLGDLEAMAQEAEALARRLEEGRLDGDTRERQERLFHRLLDAGRSLEKEEFSEERESARPGDFERERAGPLSADDLGILRFRAPDAETLRQLPPAARALVLQYFQRLNQGRAPAGSGGGGR